MQGEAYAVQGGQGGVWAMQGGALQGTATNHAPQQVKAANTNGNPC